ncbi:MAG: hypothetical protein U0414_31480 [Polyangiaceae bacterium]
MDRGGRLLACACGLCAAGCGAAPPTALRLSAATEVRVSAIAELGGPRDATVTTITSADQLLDGDEASGEYGDVLLENGLVSVVIADADGSDRSGAIVDLALRPARVDALRAFETEVLGEPVRYGAMKTGVGPRGAAFVEVAGEASGVPVVTRYELFRGVDGVLAHTSFTRPSSVGALPYAVQDRLDMVPEARASCEGTHCALLGAGAGFMIRSLEERGTNVFPTNDGWFLMGVAPSAVPEGVFVYSRWIGALERADSLAIVASLAESDGQALGSVQIGLAPRPWSKARIVEPGKFTLSAISSTLIGTVDLVTTSSLHPGDRVSAKVPTGDWYLAFGNAAYATTPDEIERIHVAGGEVTKVFLEASRSP